MTLVGLAFEISALLKLKVWTCWVLLALGTLQTGESSSWHLYLGYNGTRAQLGQVILF